MSQWDKLLSRVLSLDNDLRFDELRKVLENYGYSMRAPKGGSSHHVFRKEGKDPITIPRHGAIKKAYIEKVRDVVEEETKNEGD